RSHSGSAARRGGNRATPSAGTGGPRRSPNPPRANDRHQRWPVHRNLPTVVSRTQSEGESVGRSTWGVLLIAATTVVLRLTAISQPLCPVEAVFLMVASHWGECSSGYGGYWVGRPPLIIGLFQLADLAGGPVALRLLGIVAVVVSVLLAARVG